MQSITHSFAHTHTVVPIRRNLGISTNSHNFTYDSTALSTLPCLAVRAENGESTSENQHLCIKKWRRITCCTEWQFDSRWGCRRHTVMYLLITHKLVLKTLIHYNWSGPAYEIYGMNHSL